MKIKGRWFIILPIVLYIIYLIMNTFGQNIIKNIVPILAIWSIGGLLLDLILMIPYQECSKKEEKIMEIGMFIIALPVSLIAVIFLYLIMFPAIYIITWLQNKLEKPIGNAIEFIFKKIIAVWNYIDQKLTINL